MTRKTGRSDEWSHFVLFVLSVCSATDSPRLLDGRLRSVDYNAAAIDRVDFEDLFALLCGQRRGTPAQGLGDLGYEDKPTISTFPQSPGEIGYAEP